MANAMEQINSSKVVVQTFTAPTFKLDNDKTEATRRKFLAEYDAYVQKCDASSGTGTEVHKATLKSCFEGTLLKALIKTNTFIGVDKEEQLTESMLRKYLSPVERPRELMTKSKLEEILKEIKWTFDVTFREAIHKLSMTTYKVLVDRGWEKALEDEGLSKWIVELFREKIEFPRFKAELETYHVRDKEARKSWAMTTTKARDMAESFDKTTENVSSTSKKETASRGKKRKADGEGSAAAVAGADTGTSPTERKIPLCLNIDTCRGKRHYVKDCDKTSADKKEKLLADHRKKLAEQREKVKRAKIQAVKTARESASVTRFLLEGMIVDGEADTGSAVTICGERLITQLQSRGISVEQTTLDEPRRYRIADDSLAILVEKEVSIGRLGIQTSGGVAIELRNVRLFVSKEISTLLLGRNLLSELGFSFEEFIERNSRSLGGKDMSKVEPEEAGQSGEQYIDFLGEEDEDIPDIPSEDNSAEFEEMLERTRAQGQGNDDVIQLVKQFRDVFTSDYAAEPAKVPPMKVVLKPHATPFATPLRRYKTAHRKFLDETLSKLTKMGIFRKLTEAGADWLSAPHLVDKPGSQKFRFTVDLRAINHCTEPERNSVLTIEDELAKFAGAAYFTNFDLSHCFWQFPLAEESQTKHAIVAPSGVYVPTRVLHGAKNASLYTQRILSNVFAEIYEQMAVYLDDHLIFGRTRKQWLESLRRYLTICRSRGLRLSPKKAILCADSVEWCGRRIDKEGMTHQPRHLERLLALPPPTDGAQLQQFLAAANWLRAAIPRFAEITRPLQARLRRAIVSAGSMKSQALKRQSIELGDEERQSFMTTIQAIAQRVKLSHYDPSGERRLVLSTDASSVGWAAVLTSMIPGEEDTHEPIAFLSGSFTDTQRKWSTIEHEAHAILTSMERLKAWTLTSPVIIRTDSKTISYVWKPVPQAVATRLGLSEVATNKLARWGLRLSAFDYTVEHIPGSENHFPDLLSRWGMNAKRPQKICMMRREMLVDRERLAESFYEELRKEQRRAGFPVRQRTLKYRVPDDAEHLKRRILVVAHGVYEHRSQAETLRYIRAKFAWKNLDEEVREFVERCILCACTRTGERIPRRLGNLLHGEVPNELVHFDFLFMNEGDQPYVLVMKDDLSGFCILFRCRTTSAETAAEGLALWISLFGVPRLWHSDTASHFKNRVMARLARDLGVAHKFAVAYAPWSNGTVERLCRSVLAVMRRVCSANGKAYADWHIYLPAVQRVLNSRRSDRLQGRSPSMVMTSAMDADGDLSVLLQDESDPVVVQGLPSVPEEMLSRMERDMTELHKGIQGKLSKRRHSAVQAHNQRTNIREVNFTKGDFVLIGIEDHKKVPKLSLRWKGPAKVLDLDEDEHVFHVQILGEETVRVVHASRLRHYADELVGVSEEVLEHVEREKTVYFDVEKIVDVLVDDEEGPKFEVKWLGFEESSFEPIEDMFKDCPELVRKFVESIKDKNVRSNIRRKLRL